MDCWRFVPARGPDLRVRCYLRHREHLVEQASTQIQLMQKALTQMNVQLHHVLSDVTGVTGWRFWTPIVDGERDPLKLAQLKDPRVRSSVETIAKALTGDYRPEQLFVLQQAARVLPVSTGTDCSM